MQDDHAFVGPTPSASARNDARPTDLEYAARALSREIETLRGTVTAIHQLLTVLLSDIRATADRWEADPLATDEQLGAARGWATELAAVLAPRDAVSASAARSSG